MATTATRVARLEQLGRTAQRIDVDTLGDIGAHLGALARTRESGQSVRRARAVRGILVIGLDAAAAIGPALAGLPVGIARRVR
jgi:hypothetical protein